MTQVEIQAPPARRPASHGASPTAELSARTAAGTAAGQLASKALLLAVTLASTAVVTRALGVEGYAPWATVLSLTGLVAFIADPGLSATMVRRLAAGGEGAPTRREYLLLRLGLAALAYAVLAGLALALGGRPTFVLALALGAQLLPRAAAAGAAAWLQARHRFHRQTAAEVATTTLGLGLLLGASALDASAPVLALVGVVLPAVLLALVSRRELNRLRPHGPAAGASGGVDGHGGAVEASADPGAGRDGGVAAAAARSVGGRGSSLASFLREAAPLGAAVGLFALYTRVDVAFVTAAETPAGVARYLLGYRLLDQLMFVANVVAVTLLPMLSRRAARRPLLRDTAALQSLVGVAVVGALAAAGMIALSEPLVAVLGGPEFAAAASLVVLLAPAAVGIFLNYLLGYLFISLGRGRRYLAINLAALALNLSLNAAFTLRLGAPAAATATWVTELLVVVLAVGPLVRAGGASRRAAAKALLAFAAAILAAQSVAAGLVAAPLAGLLAAAAVVVLGLGELRGAARRLRRRAGAA